jgi:hypothetical protein
LYIWRDLKKSKMELDNIRWKQRFANYLKALSQLSRFIEKGDLNELEKQGFKLFILFKIKMESFS